MNWQQGTPNKDWDDKLFNSGGHFLQSSHWAAFNIALGKQVFYASGEGWQCLAILESLKKNPRIYAPYGPLAVSKKALEAALQELKQLAKQTGANFVRVEPISKITKTDLKALGLKPALKDIQPPQTWVQDLTKPREEIFAEFTSSNRNLFNTYAKKGLSIRTSQNPADMSVFLETIHDVANRTGMQPHSDKYYQTMAETLLPRQASTIYIVESEGQAIAVGFVFDSPVTRYYAHAGNLQSARKLRPGAPLVATMIFDAQQNGQKEFDFVGVAPPDAPKDHRWAGFTEFKQGFGGQYKIYLGTWELPTSTKYRLYRQVYKAYKKISKR